MKNGLHLGIRILINLGNYLFKKMNPEKNQYKLPIKQRAKHLKNMLGEILK